MERVDRIILRTILLAFTLLCLASVVAAAGLQTAGEAEEEIKKLVVMIEARLAGGPSLGSGIIVGIKADTLYIATANHVARRGALEAEEIKMWFRWLPDRPVKARLLQHRDAEMDLAVLEVTGLLESAADALPFDHLGNLNLLQRGDALYLLGNPGGRPWRINTAPEKYIEMSKDSLEFESNLVAEGHSGGALLNGERELLGMLVSDVPPYGRAISITRVIARVQEWGYSVNLHHPYAQISAGYQRTCRATYDGAANCWGHSSPFEPSDFTAGTQHIKSVRLRSISVGMYHICGVAFGGDAYCLGLNDYGQLGRGSTEGDRYSSIARVQGGVTFASISAGGWHTCGLTPSGSVYCWGAGTEGGLGNDSGDDSPVPVPVSGGLTFRMISAGFGNTCGITSTSAAYCWGGIGGIGTPRGGADPPNVSVPVPVPGGLTFRTISAGQALICGLTPSGAAYCWGNNEDGQLGNGSDKASDTPVPVSGRLTFKSVSATLGGHACGVTTSGAAYCWGMNSSGQLGNGSKNDSHAPVAVSGGLTFASISAGHFHTCGVTTDDTTYCWGAAGKYESEPGEYESGLGVGAKTGSIVPVRVPALP